MASKTSRSGAHVNPRRLVTATQEEFARWDAVARGRGLTWTGLVRELLESASNQALPKKRQGRVK